MSKYLDMKQLKRRMLPRLYKVNRNYLMKLYVLIKVIYFGGVPEADMEDGNKQYKVCSVH